MKNQFRQILFETAPSWLVILLCVNGIQNPAVSEFESVGTLTYAGSSPNGRVSAYADLASKVFYRNGSWLIQTFPAVGGRIGGNVERHEMGMVNDEIYFVSKFRTNRVRRLVRFQEGEGLVDVDLQQEGIDYPQYKTKKRGRGSHLWIQHSSTRKPFYASALYRVYIRRSHPTREARQFAQILDKSCAVSYIYTNYGLAHLADDSRVGGIYQSVQRRFGSPYTLMEK